MRFHLHLRPPLDFLATERGLSLLVGSDRDPPVRGCVVVSDLYTRAEDSLAKSAPPAGFWTSCREETYKACICSGRCDIPLGFSLNSRSRDDHCYSYI